MKFKDSNYWALVLGGSSGIGLATARKLAAEGMHLCIVHRDRRASMPALESEFSAIRKNGVNVVTFNANALTNEERQEITAKLRQALGGHGKIRLLLHAIAKGNLKPLVAQQRSRLQQRLLQHEANGSLMKAGGTDEAPSEGSEVLAEEDFQQTVHAMAISLVGWAQTILSHGCFATDARIISLTSEGNKKAWRGYAAVSAAKVAIEAISRSLALEFAPHGIRTNVIQAGITDTPSLRMIPGAELLKASALERNPFNRLTTPEDVANVISLLCTDEASWINGSLIHVNGGEHLC